MAVEKKYICDSCGSHVTPENGVIGDKEFTVEKSSVYKGDKVSVMVSLEDSQGDDPVVCATCLKTLFEEWLTTGKNYIHGTNDAIKN